MRKASREFGAETPKAPLAVTSNESHMNNLTRFENDDIEIFIDIEGNSFASIRGAARMAERPASTIKRFIGVAKIDVINVEVDTPSGKQGVALLSERSIGIILAKYNPDRLVQFAEFGIKTALHQIAGYQQQPIESKSKPKIEDLTLRQTRTLLLIATLREAYDREFKGEHWLNGIDPVFWNMPLLALENLNDRLTLADDEFFQDLLGQYHHARLGTTHPAAYRSELNSIVSGLRDGRARVAEAKKRKAFEEFAAELEILNLLKPNAAQKIVDDMLTRDLKDLGIDIADCPSLISKL